MPAFDSTPDAMTTMNQVVDCPTSNIDLYAEASLLEPYRPYRELRDLGPVVYFPQYDLYALTRYDDVRSALRNPKVFSSAQGVMMNERMNQQLRGIVLCSDDPEHAALRKVIQKPITPQAVQQYQAQIEREANGLIERLAAKGRIDAATELAQYLPVTIVSELVGLPEEGRGRMLQWAAANFQCFGPMNPRTEEAFVTVGEMVEYAFTQCTREKLKPDGWARAIWDAADRGEISLDKPPLMMNDYMGPSLDTTIFATASLIWLFATHPEQWDRLRADPSLIPRAIDEAIRIESPIQGFSRVATEAVDYQGGHIPEGGRVLVMYGSANRDERKWGNPDDFDIGRANADHLGFGFGTHVCVGMHLAKLEISALLRALIPRVRRFELHDTPRRVVNNVLRGFGQLDVTLVS
jgi:cytochrome P450